MTLYSDPDDAVGPGASGGGASPKRRWTPKSLGAWLIAASLLVTVGAVSIPASFAVESPGPWWNTIGTSNTFDSCRPTPSSTSSTPVIDISGAQTFNNPGSLDLLTVCLEGDPSRRPDWFTVMGAFFDPTRSIVAFDFVYPPDVSVEQVDQASTNDMMNSQAVAVIAALTHLGYDVPLGANVAETVAGGSSVGVLKANDLIVGVNGTPTPSITDLQDTLQTIPVGEDASLDVVRDGSRQTIAVEVMEKDGKHLIGISGNSDYRLPFDVTINLDGVGGPSAGMMFALGVIDKLTPGGLTGGRHVAGTGTISTTGEVGPIGGIRQKMYTAIAAGASDFLAPADDCSEVAGNVPQGLRVFAVRTIDDALAALRAISTGDNAAAEKLPTCQ